MPEIEPTKCGARGQADIDIVASGCIPPLQAKGRHEMTREHPRTISKVLPLSSIDVIAKQMGQDTKASQTDHKKYAQWNFDHVALCKVSKAPGSKGEIPFHW